MRRLDEESMVYSQVSIHKMENGWQVTVGYYAKDPLFRSWGKTDSAITFHKYWVYSELIGALDKVYELAEGCKTQWEPAKEEEGDK